MAIEAELRSQLAVLRDTVERLTRENSAMRDREMAWSAKLSELRRERDGLRESLTKTTNLAADWMNRAMEYKAEAGKLYAERADHWEEIE